MRAVAAFAGHARTVFFVDYPELTAQGGGGPLTQAFYTLTGLGHQSVLVFFVLSGFFIGQAIRSRHAPPASWSWGAYLIDRLSRLHIVLIPALLLTLGCDVLGQALMPALYDGTFPGGLVPDVAPRLGVGPFALNSVYLQTIAGPTFGSNGALWSLAYELWYYLLFPLGLRALVAPDLRERLV